MMHRWTFLLLFVAGAGMLSAQGPTLTATVTQTPHAVTLTVTGASSGDHVMLVASLTQGSYPMMMGITLGVLPPFVIMDMGIADASGQVSQTYTLGTGVPPGITVYAQAGAVTMNTSTGGMGGGGMGGSGCGGTGGGGMGGGGTGTMMTVVLTNVISFVS
jgi:hypothetical protein